MKALFPIVEQLEVACCPFREILFAKSLLNDLRVFCSFSPFARRTYLLPLCVLNDCKDCGQASRQAEQNHYRGGCTAVALCRLSPRNLESQEGDCNPSPSEPRGESPCYLPDPTGLTAAGRYPKNRGKASHSGCDRYVGTVLEEGPVPATGCSIDLSSCAFPDFCIRPLFHVAFLCLVGWMISDLRGGSAA